MSKTSKNIFRRTFIVTSFIVTSCIAFIFSVISTIEYTNYRVDGEEATMRSIKIIGVLFLFHLILFLIKLPREKPTE